VDAGHITPCWIIECGFDDFASSFLLFSKNCKELTDLGRETAAATFFDVRFSRFFSGTGNGTLHAMHVGGTCGELTPRLGGFDLRVALNPARSIRSPGNVQEI